MRGPPEVDGVVAAPRHQEAAPVAQAGQLTTIINLEIINVK